MDYSNLLSVNSGEQQARVLFHSYESDENSFNNRFIDIFSVPYKTVFGSVPVEKVLFGLLKRFYKNDFYVRHTFISKVLSKSSAISYEELPIRSSRIDLISINGKSVAYEIKSKYDSYSKLSRQISDYSMCFEYVYVICPYNKVNSISKIIPDYCGIYCYSNDISTKFTIVREAKFSPNLDALEILKLFRKKDLKKYFNESSLDAFNNYSFDAINKTFKRMMKEKYKTKWLELKEKSNSLI